MIQLFNPKKFKEYLKQTPIYHSLYPTKAGNLIVLHTKDGVLHASFALDDYEQYPYAPNFDSSKLLLVGTDFQIKVWQALLQLPKNSTTTYQSIAQTVGRPTAWRAAANAIGANNIAYFVPCHLVIRKNNDLGGYRWGIDKKIALLKPD